LGNIFNKLLPCKGNDTKEMQFGNDQEPFALKRFLEYNPSYSVEIVGILIHKKYPWLAYSPDGVILEKGVPTRLLEIKCPYLGKSLI
jgi:hypothetical protein